MSKKKPTTDPLKPTVRTPLTPNFIEVNGKYISIAEFTDEQLIEIAEDWKKKLLEIARKRRLAQ